MFSETIVLKSNKDVHFILQKLKKDTEPTKFRFFNISEKIFEGYVDCSNFEITTGNKNYRNSFAPYVKGVISENQNGVHIHLKLKLHPFVFTFSVLISLVFLITTVGLLTHQIANGYSEPLLNILLFLCIFTGFFLPIWGYRKDRKVILEYFELNFCNSWYDK